jgi:hypothetical protein
MFQTNLYRSLPNQSAHSRLENRRGDILSDERLSGRTNRTEFVGKRNHSSHIRAVHDSVCWTQIFDISLRRMDGDIQWLLICQNESGLSGPTKALPRLISEWIDSALFWRLIDGMKSNDFNLLSLLMEFRGFAAFGHFSLFVENWDFQAVVCHFLDSY